MARCEAVSGVVEVFVADVGERVEKRLPSDPRERGVVLGRDDEGGLPDGREAPPKVGASQRPSGAGDAAPGVVLK